MKPALRSNQQASDQATAPRLLSLLPSLLPGLLLALLLSLALTGCGSSGPARSDSYYRLDLSTTPNGTPAKAHHHYPGTVLVSKLDGRGFAGDRAMIFRDASKQDQVQRYTYHLWAEAPPLSLQDLMARYLREADIAEFVVTPTQRVRADLIISGTLYRIEHHPYDNPPGVAIELELGVVRADRREPLLLKRYRSTQTATDEQISSAIPAFDRAVADIFSQFLTDLDHAIATLDAPAAGR